MSDRDSALGATLDENERLRAELALRVCIGPAHICHNLATERSENKRLAAELAQCRAVLRTIVYDRDTHWEGPIRWVRLYPEDEHNADAALAGAAEPSCNCPARARCSVNDDGHQCALPSGHDGSHLA